MHPADDEHQLIGKPCGDASLPGPEHMTAHHAEIHVAVADALLDHTGIGDVQGEVDIRIAALKSGDDTWQDVDAGRGPGADHKRAMLETVEMRQRLAAIL